MRLPLSLAAKSGELLQASCHERGCEEKETRVIPRKPHSFGLWTETLASTCSAAGSEKRACSVCGHEESRAIPAIAHVYSDDWSSDTKNHWRAAECGHANEVIDRALHVFGDDDAGGAVEDSGGFGDIADDAVAVDFFVDEDGNGKGEITLSLGAFSFGSDAALNLQTGADISGFFNVGLLDGAALTGEYANANKILDLTSLTASPSGAFNNMFSSTGGDFTGAPSVGKSYYTSNAVVTAGSGS